MGIKDLAVMFYRTNFTIPKALSIHDSVAFKVPVTESFFCFNSCNPNRKDYLCGQINNFKS
jgi:hypothetical protein